MVWIVYHFALTSGHKIILGKMRQYIYELLTWAVGKEENKQAAKGRNGGA